MISVNILSKLSQTHCFEISSLEFQWKEILGFLRSKEYELW